MHIDWWTLALQAVNFLVLVWLLWRFLYRPVKAVIERRKALAEEAFAEARKAEEAAAEARRALDAERAALEGERQSLAKSMHETLEAERGRVLEQARRDGDELIAAARAAVAEERDAALTAVRGQVVDLAAELAATLLAKAGAGALDDLFLEKIEDQFRALPDDERNRLVAAAADGARLTVATANPLAAEVQARWRDRLGACLGAAPPIDFATDPALVGGAEVRFPHARLRFAWADQLEHAKALLSGHETDT